MSQLPMRVLVKGASTVNWVSWMGGPRTDFTFPRVVEEQLLVAGQACDVRTVTMASEKTSAILASWQREVVSWSPDVIVLVYGHYETIHYVLPRWLERHANSLKAKPRWWSQFYRQKLLRPMWMTLAKLQAALDTRLDSTIRRRRPQRVAADLRAYIDNVQQVGSPLVFCFELLPPHEKYHAWFPGMPERIEVMNAAISDMVTRVGRDNVRHFKVRPVLEAHNGGDLVDATPDGFHYSPAFHRAVGEALAAEILAWAATQPHLGASRAAAPEAAPEVNDRIHGGAR